MSSSDQQIEIASELKREKLELLKKQIELRRDLPHLYGFKLYKWQREFIESMNPDVLLTAANQIGKSSSQILKVITWATSPELWPHLWRKKPSQFWYLYPAKDVASIEFETKWKKDFLPKGDYKNHPIYGWREEKKGRGDIFALHFNSGVSIYFKTYAQDVNHLQSGTVDYVACFPAGTKISTPFGSMNIEDIRIGNLVKSHTGINRVTNNSGVIKSVYSRSTSIGLVVQSTDDHPYFTLNRGWVSFDGLTDEDLLVSDTGWKNSQTKKSFYLTNNFLFVFLKALIQGLQITLGAGLFIITSSFGKFFMIEKFQTVTLSITKTLIHSITKLKIWCLYREKIIHASTKCKSGKKLAAKKSCVWNALKHLTPQSLLQSVLSIVLKGVCKLITDTALNAGLVMQVGKLVQVSEHQSVYNLTVENDHTFFADGVLVHNCDEELPEMLYDELQFRRNATSGYFSMVFTATLGQEMWRLAMEPKQGEKEKFPHAFKQQISLFECQKFEDGSPSHWTNDKIARTIASCRNEAEVQRRVYGKFVISEGLKYGGFTRAGNVVRPFDIPSDWLHFVGVDIGAGGDKNHPSAISFIAVKPDYSYGCVYRHWRGDEEITTMSDVANKYLELRLSTPITGAYYDYHARDFKTITDRMGLSFMAAEKRHDIGEQVINTLFKSGMLVIFDTPECEPIIRELSTLILGQDKRQAKDDSVDSMRYGITNIPWDWTKAEVDPLYRPKAPEPNLSSTDYADQQRMKDAKRMFSRDAQDEFNAGVEQELQAWGELYDV